MKVVILGTMRSVRTTRCQCFKDVHKESCDCICLSHFYANISNSAIGHLGIRNSSAMICLSNHQTIASQCVIAHFTVTSENEAGVDLVLIQPLLLYYVNNVVLMLTSIF